MKNTKTEYMGIVTGTGHVIAVVTDGTDYYTCPHVKSLNGRFMKPIHNLKNDFCKKHEIRYLTQYEVICFMKGIDTNGNPVKTPEELQAESDAKMREYYQTKEGKEFFEKLEKDSETNETIKELYEFVKNKYFKD